MKTLNGPTHRTSEGRSNNQPVPEQGHALGSRLTVTLDATHWLYSSSPHTWMYKVWLLRTESLVQGRLGAKK